MIDEIIIPAYLLDSKIEMEKLNILKQQKKHIAKYVILKLERNEVNFKKHCSLT